MSSGNHDELLIEVASEYRRSLAEWLNSEEDLRGLVSAVRPAPEAGKMGTAVELLTVALGSGGAGAVLVRSISTWLTQRRSEVSVSLKDADGHEFQFTSKSTKQDPADVFREASTLFTTLRDNSSSQEQADR
jgi:Effector Associated Constant Component 1